MVPHRKIAPLSTGVRLGDGPKKKKETVALRQGEKKEEVVSLQAVEHHGKMWHHVEHSQDGKEEVNKIKRKW